ncbi:SpoIIE family protein phosphatase [Nonomuraea sp. NPDC059023]|uniref:SpoIIE family protein phosphatase n=1 Tax=unclassified Nonomuraea TaxID=2593643 RepID=UPI0036C715E8
MRRRCASTTSRLDTVRAWICRASSQANSSHISDIAPLLRCRAEESRGHRHKIAVLCLRTVSAAQISRRLSTFGTPVYSSRHSVVAGPECRQQCLRVPEPGRATSGLISLGCHNPALILRADGTVHEAGRPGHLLGLFDQVDLHAELVEPAPGDALPLYTDGVTEAHRRGPQAAIWGMAALADAPPRYWTASPPASPGMPEAIAATTPPCRCVFPQLVRVRHERVTGSGLAAKHARHLRRHRPPARELATDRRRESADTG